MARPLFRRVMCGWVTGRVLLGDAAAGGGHLVASLLLNAVLTTNGALPLARSSTASMCEKNASLSRDPLSLPCHPTTGSPSITTLAVILYESQRAAGY